jgi:hypothetical protein
MSIMNSTITNPASRSDVGARQIACLVIIALFVVAAAVAALRKEITRGFDEVAHVSYVAHLQRSGELWPALETVPMLDPGTFEFTREDNYLNHPPMYYLLLAKSGPVLEGHPRAVLVHRLLNVVLGTIGLAALLALAVAAQLTREQLYAYAVPIALIPVLVPLAGAVNNDNLAFAGGAVATFAAWQLVATGRAGWLALGLVAVVAAAWAKLTGFLLTGGLMGAICLYLVWRGRLNCRWLFLVALAFAVAAAPYAIFFAQYGSPVPNTPAQIALIEIGSREAGWDVLPRKSFPGYAAHFVSMFIHDWMPTLADRSTFHYAMLAIPVAAVGCALAGFFASLRRLWRRQGAALDVVVISGMVIIATVFSIHVFYSYSRHVATGYLMETYPRYYLPLAAILPLAALSLVSAVDRPALRNALLAFLIAGPIAFRFLGAPLY